MVRSLVALFLLFSVSSGFSQTSFPADSLLKVADNSTVDSVKMHVFNKLGNYYLDNNVTKAIEYFEKAKAIAQKEKRVLNVANNFYSIGYCYLIKADYDQSLFNYQQSVAGYEKLKDTFRLTNALMSIGNVYFQNHDFGNTSAYYLKAEQLAEAMNDTLQLSAVLDSRGTSYDRMGKFDSALIYLRKSYQMEMQVNQPGYAMSTLSNIGLTYKHQFKTALALEKFDSVLHYFQENNEATDRVAALYNNIAATHAQAANYKEAETFFKKSIALAREAGSPPVEMENYRNLADMYGNMKSYELQARYLTQYYNLKDSIFNIDSKNQLTQLEADYQLNKKNIEIVKQEAEVSKQKSQRNIFIVVALAAALLLTILALFYSRTRKINSALQEKNIQINKQKNELQTLNKVKDRLFSIISHDLRNPMVTLRSYLALADNENLPVEKKQEFRLQTINAVINTSDMLDNLLAWANVQIKNDDTAIVPVSLVDCTWDTVHSVEAQAAQKSIRIETDVAVEMALGDYDIIAIALRNLTTNAIKFSHTGSEVRISSSKENDKILLQVKDNGMGMSSEQIDEILSKTNSSSMGTSGEKGSGLGLFLVQELLQKINAQLKVDSAIGKGSLFTVILN